jgi:hypothetical protein
LRLPDPNTAKAVHGDCASAVQLATRVRTSICDRNVLESAASMDTKRACLRSSDGLAIGSVVPLCLTMWLVGPVCALDTERLMTVVTRLTIGGRMVDCRAPLAPTTVAVATS